MYRIWLAEGHVISTKAYSGVGTIEMMLDWSKQSIMVLHTLHVLTLMT